MPGTGVGHWLGGPHAFAHLKGSEQGAGVTWCPGVCADHVQALPFPAGATAGWDGLLACLFVQTDGF